MPNGYRIVAGNVSFGVAAHRSLFIVDTSGQVVARIDGKRGHTPLHCQRLGSLFACAVAARPSLAPRSGGGIEGGAKCMLYKLDSRARPWTAGIVASSANKSRRDAGGPYLPSAA
jgi:hypothetical protein